MTEYERLKSFPDQSHWKDFTIDGKPIPVALHYTVSFWDTDQAKASRNIWEVRNSGCDISDMNGGRFSPDLTD